ncbi:MAG: IS66 family transposase, partial [Ruminococcaceae bacterium]|nr:IS66 family transposase [Oscillospiraceae bacterium]
MNREIVSETSNAEMVSITRAEYGEFLELREQNRWLMEQLRVIKSKQFGSKSEKSSEQVSEQLSLLFDEAEAWVVIEEKQAATKVKEHTRSRKSGNVRDILPENIEVVEVEHTLPEEERACPQCGETMQPIGKE